MPPFNDFYKALLNKAVLLCCAPASVELIRVFATYTLWKRVFILSVVLEGVKLTFFFPQVALNTLL